MAKSLGGVAGELVLAVRLTKKSKPFQLFNTILSESCFLNETQSAFSHCVRDAILFFRL